ncbi:protein OXIDATIVE STRESS 3 LIKE 4 [Elaeis guineensis]|uniref:Uncharacterized protein LOC105034087 n=1 Tax=Elaeis guineensis var. tenera TaxID=51953 RepID=A0A6I9QEQ2_ELAGV|nr:uncharacterized protein LOC105034087 [Elaeis guineensis]
MAPTNISPSSSSTSDKELEGINIFDMGSLRSHLPQKRKGLSNYFSGKSRSFTCLADAKCVNDLKKEEIPEAKRRKYLDRREAICHSPLSCRTETSSGSYSRSCVGV